MSLLDRILREMPPIICIAGPTASGKSGYAVRLARAVDGEIVNADALQVYSDLQILSARPTQDEMVSIPHHLFGHVDGATAYSTGDWARDAQPVIFDILARKRSPIITGGTGLYFKALLQGLADIPEITHTVRMAVRERSVSTLRVQAQTHDPAAYARLQGDDPQRLARIVEVYEQTGRPLSGWQAKTRPLIPPQHVHAAVILPDRETLYDRINRRFDAMIDAGALEEARRVHRLNIMKTAPMTKAIGLSHLLKHFDGDYTLDEAIMLAKRDSRRLAKRQMTWFRNQTPDWTRLENDQDMAAFTTRF